MNKKTAKKGAKKEVALKTAVVVPTEGANSKKAFQDCNAHSKGKMIAAATEMMEKVKEEIQKKTKKSAFKMVCQQQPTRITVIYDVGFGNQIYLRGEGAGLSWDRGILLENKGSDVWQWETSCPDDIEFKVLINDSNWEQGENHNVSGGSQYDCHPQF